MLDLTDVSGLPIKIDENTGTIIYDDEVNCENECSIRLNEIIPVLLNRYLKYPELVYRHLRNIFHHKDSAVAGNGLSFDVFSVPYGLLGIEYIKTHIYYTPRSEGKYACVIEVLEGKLTIILQRNADEQDDLALETFVDELKVVTLTKGQRIAIPTGYFYNFINTEQRPVAFSKVAASELKEIDYTVLQSERGLAYYFISKNARIEIVPNPKYKILNEIEEYDYEDIMEDDLFGAKHEQIFQTDSPLYKLFCQEYDFFKKLISTH
jgi:oxalate decarboxylase/phosphoglucose isomerase-like protein (cupin superfamily)